MYHIPYDEERQAPIINLRSDMTYTIDSDSDYLIAHSSSESLNMYAESMNKFVDDAAIRFECAIFTATTWESLQEYYKNVFEMCEKNNFSWFSNDLYCIINPFNFTTNKLINMPEKQQYQDYKYFIQEYFDLLKSHQSSDK